MVGESGSGKSTAPWMGRNMSEQLVIQSYHLNKGLYIYIYYVYIYICIYIYIICIYIYIMCIYIYIICIYIYIYYGKSAGLIGYSGTINDC